MIVGFWLFFHLFLTVTNWSTQVIKKSREPNQLINTVSLIIHSVHKTTSPFQQTRNSITTLKYFQNSLLFINFSEYDQIDTSIITTAGTNTRMAFYHVDLQLIMWTIQRLIHYHFRGPHHTIKQKCNYFILRCTHEHEEARSEKFLFKDLRIYQQ